MIWFRCKQCGKTHGRPGDLSGTIVFCACGNGNRVPWESTAEAPPALPPAPVPPPRRGEDDAPPAPRTRRGVPPVRPDPDRCLNHGDRPRVAACDACREAFCAACVVTLEGRTLCGPCKDFRVRAARRPPRVSALAVVSFLLGLVVAGPVSFCLPLISATGQAQGNMGPAEALVVGLMGVALPLTAFLLGVLALREIETKPDVSGRPVALTGAVAGGVGVLWCLAVFLAVVFKHGG